ncbi:MAG: EscU/YscU/HrcU family type III secretion system export apparatus switch protein [Thiobacillus sp.]
MPTANKQHAASGDVAASAALQPRPTPRECAALAYRGGDAAPRVVAKGRGIVADSIIEKALASGVYVHESRELLALLMQIDLDSRIPPQLYIAVAELLAWLYHLEAADQPALPNLTA